VIWLPSKQDTVYGEADDLGAVPELFVTANLQKKDLGSCDEDVQKVVASLGKLPRGLVMDVRGLSNVLIDTLDSLQNGLIVAIIVIYLMLAANFQSFKVALVAVVYRAGGIAGIPGLLMLTGSTLNLQSYMG
jgi:multidrug efflux pump subunit AcrB